MSETSVMLSDYLKDFNSFYFVGRNAFCMRFVDEFYSRTALLKLAFDKEKKKEKEKEEDRLCSSIF